MKQAVATWLRIPGTDLFCAKLQTLVPWWDKCLNVVWTASPLQHMCHGYIESGIKLLKHLLFHSNLNMATDHPDKECFCSFSFCPLRPVHPDILIGMTVLIATTAPGAAHCHCHVYISCTVLPRTHKK
jgi:hypothetical protein